MQKLWRKLKLWNGIKKKQMKFWNEKKKGKGERRFVKRHVYAHRFAKDTWEYLTVFQGIKLF